MKNKTKILTAGMFLTDYLIRTLLLCQHPDTIIDKRYYDDTYIHLNSLVNEFLRQLEKAKQ